MVDKKTAIKKAPAKEATKVKTVAELRQDLDALQAEYAEHKRSHAQGELVNPHILTVKRKAIARLHTAITAGERAERKEK